MTWQEDAYRRIEEIGRGFTPEMTLKEKRIILCDLGDDFARGTSWPRKAWAKAQRQYLERFHNQPKGYGLRKVETPLPATPAQMDAFEQKGTLL